MKSPIGVLVGTVALLVSVSSVAWAGPFEVRAGTFEPTRHDQRWTRFPRDLIGDGEFIAPVKMPVGATATGLDFTVFYKQTS